MSPEQEKNLAIIKEHFAVLVENKYRQGDKEHGGDLIDMQPLQILDMSIDEAIDQVVYLITLRRKLVAD